MQVTSSISVSSARQTLALRLLSIQEISTFSLSVVWEPGPRDHKEPQAYKARPAFKVRKVRRVRQVAEQTSRLGLRDPFGLKVRLGELTHSPRVHLDMF